MKFSGVKILQGVEISIFLLIFEWALQQCSATALPVIRDSMIMRYTIIHVQSSSFLSLCRQPTLLRPVHHDRHLCQQHRARRRRPGSREIHPQHHSQLLRFRLHRRLYRRTRSQGSYKSSSVRYVLYVYV